MNQPPRTISGQEVISAVLRAAQALDAGHETLTALDQALGDGDLGITALKIAAALREYAQTNPAGDLGKWLAGAGLAVNKAASSTMGTLLATALMRAGKEARGLAVLTPAALSAMLAAADLGIQERGKARMGEKTIVDALHPAVEAFAAALLEDRSLEEAGDRMLAAAEAGRDSVTPLKSATGRASWVGERTIGKVDPGCEALVILLKAVIKE